MADPNAIPGVPMEDPMQSAPGVEPTVRGGPPSSSIGLSANRLAPTGEEMVREAGYGTAAGAAEGATVFGSGVGGLRLGTMAAPFSGPLAPVMPAVGFVGGLTAGYLLSRDFDSYFPGVPRPDLVPYREGGKTFGATIGAAPFAFGLPAIQGGRVAELVTKIGDSARKYPKTYLTGETLSGVASGIAGGTAVEYAPESPGTRLTAEIVAGIFAPGRFVANAGASTIDFLGTMKRSMSDDSRQGRAANRLITILTETGEDIPSLIKRLEASTPAGATPSAAQKTGSATLGVLETTLARNSPKYAAALRKQGSDTIRAYELLIQDLNQIGTPEAFRQAAILRKQQFEDLLEGRLRAAETDAALKIGRITADTPAARAEIGQTVQFYTQEALRDARLYEKSLWTEAFRDTLRTQKGQLVPRTIVPENTGKAALEIGATMTPERFNTLPLEVRSIMGRLGITGDTLNLFKQGRRTQEFLTTGQVPAEFLTQPVGGKSQRRVSIFEKTDVEDLINIRSDLLDFARNASSAGQVANAGFYSKMADAVLKDLESMRLPNYDKARDFSRTLNDYFTRSFASQLSKTPTRGVQPYAPEILVQRAFGANNDMTALRMADIEDAVGLMRREYDEAVKKFGAKSKQAMALEPSAQMANEAVTSIQDAQTRVLRLAAAKTINPQTGQLNTRALQKFVNENRMTLDRLQITSDLENAVRAESAFRALETTTSQVVKRANDQAAFAKIIKLGPYEQAAENPTRIIADVLNSKNPVKNFAGLARLAKSGGADAVDGFKSSLFDYAFIKAGGEKGFSPAAFQKALFEPLSPGQPSLYSIMRSNDVMSLTEGKNLRRLIAPMETVERAMRNNQLMDEVIQGGDAVTELALRVIGSRIGSSVASDGPGSLIAASAGSKYMRSIFDKNPTLMIRGIIEEATRDPGLMAQLLKRGVTEGEKFNMARSLHAYLTAAGLNYASFEERQPPQQFRPRNYFDVPMPNFNVPTAPTPAPAPFRSDASQMLKKLPKGPQTRGVPSLSMMQEQQAMPPEGGAGPQGAPSNARAAFQQLFPMDTVAPLLNQPPAG